MRENIFIITALEQATSLGLGYITLTTNESKEKERERENSSYYTTLTGVQIPWTTVSFLSPSDF